MRLELILEDELAEKYELRMIFKVPSLGEQWVTVKGTFPGSGGSVLMG